MMHSRPYPHARECLRHPWLRRRFDCCSRRQAIGPARERIGSLPIPQRRRRSLSDLTSGILRLPSLSPGPRAMRDGVVFAGWTYEPVVPILFKRSQEGLGNADDLSGNVVSPVQAMPAGAKGRCCWIDELSKERNMSQISGLKSGRDRPQLCARESSAQIAAWPELSVRQCRALRVPALYLTLRS